jgi:predicted nucleotidyltransferase
MRSDLPALAVDIGVSQRSLRRAVQRGTVRARRPGPRQIELASGEREYLREHWGLIAALADALRTERNVRLAVLFGSLARGDAGEGSDVDLLVWFAREQPLCKARLAARLTQTLRRDVDVLSLDPVRERDPVLFGAILREGRPVIDRDRMWLALRAEQAAVGRAATNARKARRRRAGQALAQLVGNA